MPETFLARFPVSGKSFCDQREKFFSRLRPTAEDVSAFGQHRKFPPQARKTSGTQGKENEAETENARHGRREIWTPTLSRPPTPSQCTIVYAKKQFNLFYITYDVLYSESTFSGLKLRNYLASYLIKCYCQSIKLFGQHSQIISYSNTINFLQEKKKDPCLYKNPTCY